MKSSAPDIPVGCDTQISLHVDCTDEHTSTSHHHYCHTGMLVAAGSDKARTGAIGTIFPPIEICIVTVILSVAAASVAVQFAGINVCASPSTAIQLASQTYAHIVAIFRAGSDVSPVQVNPSTLLNQQADQASEWMRTDHECSIVASVVLVFQYALILAVRSHPGHAKSTARSLTKSRRDDNKEEGAAPRLSFRLPTAPSWGQVRENGEPPPPASRQHAGVRVGWNLGSRTAVLSNRLRGCGQSLALLHVEEGRFRGTLRRVCWFGMTRPQVEGWGVAANNTYL